MPPCIQDDAPTDQRDALTDPPGEGETAGDAHGLAELALGAVREWVKRNPSVTTSPDVGRPP
jgi:hypothetical protein